VYHLSRRLALNLAEKGADWMSGRGVLSFICAALLHDLGHFPYTHSLKELSLDSHETLTGRLILAEPLKSLCAAAGADPEFTAAIVDTSMPASDGELLFYRKLLSGVLDPDKLDYLNRDARYCGVPYGAQDVDFILSRLHPQKERGVDIDSRGIPSVESILFSKYLMYRTVYWHRQVRSATAMIKKALLSGLRNGIICGEDLYGLDDQELFKLMEEKKHPLFSLAGDVKNGKLYAESAAFPYNEEQHAPLKDVRKRHLYEEALAGELSRAGGAIDPKSLIIDLPEPVSLESSLFVEDEGCIFTQSSSAFKEKTVESFAKSLRIVRIFTTEKVNIPEGILNNAQKWLHL
jgi:HD superfamily phosphohydrolase